MLLGKRIAATTKSALSPSHAKAKAATAIQSRNVTTLLEDKTSGYGFVKHNALDGKPRSKGLTEIRGPYYSVMGKRYLSDVLETMGDYVDGLKFAGGSFTLFPEDKLREIIDLAHQYGVYVSTGGFAETLLTQADNVVAIEKYLKKCKQVGFDVIELSTGFLSLPSDDWCRLVDTVQNHGLKPKPELGIAFGAGGDTPDIEATSDPSGLVTQAKKFFQQGCEKIMIESEGITENVSTMRTDVINQIAKELPLEKCMFEAADPKVFNWYIREFGTDVNLFVDHSQIVQLSGLRRGIWGQSDTFGRVVSYKPDI